MLAVAMLCLGAGAKDVPDHLSPCIAGANTLRRCDLCVVDGTVVLAKNRPQGPGDLFKPGKVVAGTDPVALHAYGARLHQRQPEEIRMLARAAAHGLGTPLLKGLAVREQAGS